MPRKLGFLGASSSCSETSAVTPCVTVSGGASDQNQSAADSVITKVENVFS